MNSTTIRSELYYSPSSTWLLLNSWWHDITTYPLTGLPPQPSLQSFRTTISPHLDSPARRGIETPNYHSLEFEIWTCHRSPHQVCCLCPQFTLVFNHFRRLGLIQLSVSSKNTLSGTFTHPTEHNNTLHLFFVSVWILKEIIAWQHTVCQNM